MNSPVKGCTFHLDFVCIFSSAVCPQRFLEHSSVSMGPTCTELAHSRHFVWFCGKMVGISLSGTASSTPEPPEHPACLRSWGESCLNGLRIPPLPGPCYSAISQDHTPEWAWGQAGNVCECGDQEGTCHVQGHWQDSSLADWGPFSRQ